MIPHTFTNVLLLPFPFAFDDDDARTAHARRARGEIDDVVVDGLLHALIVLVVDVAARGAEDAITRALHETSFACGGAAPCVRGCVCGCVRVAMCRDVAFYPSATHASFVHARPVSFARTASHTHTQRERKKDLVHTRTRNYDVLHERTHDEPRGDAEGDDDQGAKGDQRARDACGDARWAI